MTKFEKIGSGQALEAIDQADVYGGVNEALDSYFINLGDTLNEMDANTEQTDEAIYAFRSVLIGRSIAHRPHGLPQ